MRIIKFKQAIKEQLAAGITLPFRWHRWGYLGHGFDGLTLPLGKMDGDDRPSFQYTGIKDKLKKEIYEGDLLKDNGGNIGTVIWNQDDCSFCLDFPHVETQPLDREFSQSMEVVGNIYEKPRKKK
jgi:hypothetical protein